MPTIKEITQYFSRVEEHGLWVMVHYKINSTKFLRGGVPFGDKISHYQNTNTEIFHKKIYSEINKHF